MPKSPHAGKLSVLILLILLFTAACQTASVPGIDSAIDVSGGALRVSGATRTNSIGEGVTQATVRAGYDLILVNASLEGTFVPLDIPLAVVDTGGNRYRLGGLYQGQVMFEVPESAQGLMLWYGDEAQIPLYGLLGEAAPASTAATSTPRPTIAVSATPRLDVTLGAPPPVPSDTPVQGLPLPVPSDTPVQVFTLPAPTFAAMEAASESVYEVQAGDTLFMIADMFGVSIGDLLALNNLTDETELEIGQLLEIPADPTPVDTPSRPTAIPAQPTGGLFEGDLIGVGSGAVYTGHVSFQVMDGYVRNMVLTLPVSATSACRINMEDLAIVEGAFFVLGGDVSVNGTLSGSNRANITVNLRSCNGTPGNYPFYTGTASLQAP